MWHRAHGGAWHSTMQHGTRSSHGRRVRRTPTGCSHVVWAAALGYGAGHMGGMVQAVATVWGAVTGCGTGHKGGMVHGCMGGEVVWHATVKHGAGSSHGTGVQEMPIGCSHMAWAADLWCGAGRSVNSHTAWHRERP